MTDSLKTLVAAHEAHVRAELESLTADERASYADIDGNANALPAAKLTQAAKFIDQFQTVTAALVAMTQWSEMPDEAADILRRAVAELAIVEARTV